MDIHKHRYSAIILIQQGGPHRRETLLSNPTEFLKKRGWLGLLNTNTPSNISPILTIDSGPLEDITIGIKPSAPSTSSEWNRARPTASGRANTTANIDLVARERANMSHFLLEEMLAHRAKAQQFKARYNQNIDLFFDTPIGSILVEIKSCTDSNFHSQVRKAISQLFEYRYVHRELFSTNLTMLILTETAPPKEKMWLVEYVLSLGIILAWINKKREIVTTITLPKALVGLVRQIPGK